MSLIKNKKNNKKILIITECFYPEEFKINDIAFSWKARGFDVDVLTMVPTYPLGRVFNGYKNAFFQKEEWQGIRIFRLPAITGYKESILKKFLKYINFMIFGSVISIIIGRKIDYVFGFNLGSLTNMFPAVVIHKLYNKPNMFWVQDVWPDSVYAYGFKKTKILAKFLEVFVKFMYHNITAIAVSSKGFEAKLKPYTKKNLKFVYAPNWADDLKIDFVPISLSATPKVHFTFAGNVGKVQNLENIIQAFCLLSKSFQKKSQLNIIGDGSNLIKLKKYSKNNANIIFHGNQMRNEMAKYYKASDFLIISLINKSIFEATVPAKTQTYIAAKKPILAIINGEVADIVNDNNLGVCVDPSDIVIIKEAFEKCINMSKNKKSKYISNNSKLLKTTFNKENIINNITNQLIDIND